MADNTQLQAVTGRGWYCGFETFLRKENHVWWHTRRWWIQTITWLLLANGFLAILFWLAPLLESALDVIPQPAEMMMVFMDMHGMFALIGVLVLAQNVIVEEKRSGTAEWMMSGPLSRAAFILVKVIGNGFPMFIIIVVLQFAVAYVQTALRTQVWFNPIPVLLAMALFTLYLLFFLSLSILLGAIFHSSGPVIGISIGTWIGLKLMGAILSSYLPWFPLLLPETLLSDARMVVQGMPLTDQWYVPVIMTLVWIAACIAGSIWRFSREEF